MHSESTPTININEFKHTIKHLEILNDQQKQLLEVKENEIEGFKKDIASMRETISDLTMQLTEMIKMEARLRDELQGFKSSKNIHSAEIQRLANNLKEATDVIKEQQEEMVRLASREKEISLKASERIHELNQEITRLQEKMTQTTAMQIHNH